MGSYLLRPNKFVWDLKICEVALLIQNAVEATLGHILIAEYNLQISSCYYGTLFL